MAIKMTLIVDKTWSQKLAVANQFFWGFFTVNREIKWSQIKVGLQYLVFLCTVDQDRFVIVGTYF